MRVFMCFDQLAPAFGPGAFTAALAPALQRAGHRVVVFVERPIDPDNQYLCALRRAGVPVRSPAPWVDTSARAMRLEAALLLALLPLRLVLTVADVALRRRSFGRAWRGVRGRLNRLLPSRQLGDPRRWWLERALDREQRANPAVLVHTLTGVGGAFAWAARRGLPIVYNENHVPGAIAGVDWWDDVRRYVAHVRVTATVSAAAEPAIRDYLGFLGPVRVVHSTIADPDVGAGEGRAGADPGTVVIGAAGRLTAAKGFDVLLHAMRAIVDAASQTPIQLWIAGDGIERAPLEALTASLGLGGHVRFLGHRQQQDMERFWAAIDLFVLSSRAEGLPSVVLEAMAHGKAVVATAIDGVPEAVVPGVTGLLVPAEAAAPLAAAVTSLIDDGSRRAALGDAGRARFASTFRPDVVVQQLLDAYRVAVPHAV